MPGENPYVKPPPDWSNEAEAAAVSAVVGVAAEWPEDLPVDSKRVAWSPEQGAGQVQAEFSGAMWDNADQGTMGYRHQPDYHSFTRPAAYDVLNRPERQEYQLQMCIITRLLEFQMTRFM